MIGEADVNMLNQEAVLNGTHICEIIDQDSVVTQLLILILILLSGISPVDPVMFQTDIVRWYQELDAFKSSTQK